MGETPQISNVSDTAIWVAFYRAEESRQLRPMFVDPLADRLIGKRGQQIADDMKAVGKYTAWTVCMRTVIIDDFIRQLVVGGIDTIVNMGAGLDTRPYRLGLPAQVKWYELDFPSIIEHKERLLAGEKPTCDLHRIAVDLSVDPQRRDALAQITACGGRVAVLTEGVIPYLSEDQVRELGTELCADPRVHYWIAEYINPSIFPRLKMGLTRGKMRNAPFRFFPNDWFGFFNQCGWVPFETRYFADVARKHGRPFPFPRWARLMLWITRQTWNERSRNMMGFVIFQKATPQNQAKP